MPPAANGPVRYDSDGNTSSAIAGPAAIKATTLTVISFFVFIGFFLPLVVRFWQV
jgi:hypothetical protein